MDDTKRRFAILQHDYPYPHLDLLLENGEAALTWRLPADWPKNLSESPVVPVREGLDSGQGSDASEGIRKGSKSPTANATQLPDHRLHYLTYSGPVSGNRGRVIQRDHGLITSLVLAPDEVTTHLQGILFQGTVSLTRISADNWTVTWTPQNPLP